MPTGRVPATGQVFQNQASIEAPHAAGAKIRFTRRAEDAGWLKVRLDKSGATTDLCEYTRVAVLRSAGGRTSFRILDGYVAVDAEASLRDANAALYLSAIGPTESASVVVQYQGAPADEDSAFKGRLKQQWAKLSFDGQEATVTLNSVWNGKYTPIPPGTHTILAPDYSHKTISTAGYAAATPGMVGNDVWFPIGLDRSVQNSSRYIHVGHLSEGCVTVHELAKWSALYGYLIARRVPGSAGRKIGQLVVKGPQKP